ncbi:hypothetical protein B0H15DRAFT_792452, partial [Mycena belliarum]
EQYARLGTRANQATSAENFRFDILAPRHSPWNNSAARVFAELTISQLCLPNTIEMFEAIRHAFTGHLDRITRRYKHSLKSKTQQAYLEAQGRRTSRKYQVLTFLFIVPLFHQRRYLAYTFPPLQRHINMLEELGVDGMSSDESDVEDHGINVQYYIISPLWRARRLAGWLRVFDALYNILRKNSSRASRAPGAFPRNRKVTSRKSKSRKFVAGLPINVYDSQWIDSDVLRKYDLRATAEPYDFTHQDDIMEYVI